MTLLRLKRIVALTLVVGFMATALSFSPAADRALDTAGLDGLATQQAAATNIDYAVCTALGSSGGLIGPIWAAASTVIVGYACSREGRNADAICAKGMTIKYRNTMYGKIKTYYPKNKYYVCGVNKCISRHWQYTGGVYNGKWSYVR